MKKSILIAGSVLSLFLLVSLSYQPIIAEEPIIETQIEDIPIKSDDCGCNNANTRWNFPIICSLLGVFLLITMILCISLNLREFCDISMKIYDIMESLNCGVTI